jgi:flagellar protein FlaF
LNAHNLARQAYAAPDQPIRTPRGIEFEIFARVTHRLKTLPELGRSTFPALAKALHDNRKLWNLLAADVSDEANGLPKLLRAQIFYLAEFTSQHTSKVLAGEATVETLVDINTTVMRGLRAEGEAK